MASGVAQKFSNVWCRVAEKGGASLQYIQRIGAWEVDSIGITSSVPPSIFVRIVDAGRNIELNRIVGMKRWDTRERLPYLRSYFYAGRKWKFNLARVARVDFHIATYQWQGINQSISGSLFGNDFHHVHERDDVIRACIAYVLGKSLHVSRTEPIFRIANEGLKKFWWAAVDNQRHVLHLDLSVLFHAHNDVGEEIKYSSSSSDTQENYFEPPEFTGSPPPILGCGLLCLCGFLGTATGFSFLFANICFGRSKRHIFGSLGIIFISIVVFHVSLFYMLH